MFLNPCPTFSVSRLRSAMCRIPPHSCPPYDSLAFALLIYLFVSIHHHIASEIWSKTYVFFFSNEAKTRINVPLAGRLQRSPPGAPLAGPLHKPGGGRGRGEAATTSALVESSVLAYDAASTYCTG